MDRTLAFAVGLGTLLVASCGDGGGQPTEPDPVTATAVASVTLTRTALEMLIGDSVQLFATTRAQSGVVLSGRAVTWATSASTIATVTTDGIVRAQRRLGCDHCDIGGEKGNNTSGQLGDNTGVARNAPVAVATMLKFASIDAGTAHTCALTSAGAAYCWGSNGRGQLGDGTIEFRLAPAAVAGDRAFKEIRAGGFAIGQTCALTTAGLAYCWGDNERGQLGNGVSDVAAHTVPAAVSDARTFASLSVGFGRHSCALTSTGAAYCWGDNPFGALGDGSTRNSAVPVPVAGGIVFNQLAVGGYIGHTCARASSGAAYCWGENSIGQIGDASTFDRLQPATVFVAHSYTNLDAGFRHTCGRASTGIVYCWGGNSRRAPGEFIRMWSSA